MTRCSTIPDVAPWPRWCSTPCGANLVNAITKCKSGNLLSPKASTTSWTVARMISGTSAPWPKTAWKSTIPNKTTASPRLPTWTSSGPASPPVGPGSASTRPCSCWGNKSCTSKRTRWCLRTVPVKPVLPWAVLGRIERWAGARRQHRGVLLGGAQELRLQDPGRQDRLQSAGVLAQLPRSRAAQLPCVAPKRLGRAAHPLGWTPHHTRHPVPSHPTPGQRLHPAHPTHPQRLPFGVQQTCGGSPDGSELSVRLPEGGLNWQREPS